MAHRPLARGLALLALGLLALVFIPRPAATQTVATKAPAPVSAAGGAGRSSLLGGVPSDSWSSPNWAGYVLPTTSARRVAGSWIVPRLDCARGPGRLAVWLGVDGVGDSAGAGDLFQAGTDSRCRAGRQLDRIFWEWWPANAQQFVGSVRAGDRISAAVWSPSGPASTGWRWSVRDETTGKVVASSRPIPYHGAGATAEWVVEDPSLDYHKAGDYAPLAPFDAVTFEHMSVDGPAGLPTNFEDTWEIRRSGEVLARSSVPATVPGSGATMTVRYAP